MASTSASPASPPPGRSAPQHFAKAHHVETIHATWQELLADRSIDVVSICVPNALHAEIAVAAARAGKHVICEKPLTGAFGKSDGSRASSAPATNASGRADIGRGGEACGPGERRALPLCRELGLCAGHAQDQAAARDLEGRDHRYPRRGEPQRLARLALPTARNGRRRRAADARLAPDRGGAPPQGI